MSKPKLFISPGACPRVTMTALEKIGMSYDVQIIDLTKNKQKLPEYLAINPKGKVPALKIGDRLLTENAAILFHLNTYFPEAALLPKESDEFGYNQGLEDLVWCSSTLHPMTRQIRRPVLFLQNAGQDAEASVRADGIARYQPVLSELSSRFAKNEWWYGTQWSIVDVYLQWNYAGSQDAGLDLNAHPAVLAHGERVMAHPAFQKMLAREQSEVKLLEAA